MLVVFLRISLKFSRKLCLGEGSVCSWEPFVALNRKTLRIDFALRTWHVGFFSSFFSSVGRSFPVAALWKHSRHSSWRCRALAEKQHWRNQRKLDVLQSDQPQHLVKPSLCNWAIFFSDLISDKCFVYPVYMIMDLVALARSFRGSLLQSSS